MRIAVCDDDAKGREQLLQALGTWNPDLTAEQFSSGASFLEAAKAPPPFDIVFLDIYMPDENGIDIAGTLGEISPQTGIVFVTSSEDHAVAAFSLDALHYLVKPVTVEDIAAAFSRLKKQQLDSRQFISFPAGQGSRPVFLDQICYLNSVSHTVEVTLADGQQMKTWTPLSELAQKLDRNFLKVNRGIIVNMAYIEQMGPDRCVMRGGKELFLAVRERGAISAAYQDYLLDRRKEKKEAGS